MRVWSLISRISVAAVALAGIACRGQGGSVARGMVASETYLGIVGCERCAGTQVELALYRAGDAPGHGVPEAYHMRETFYGTPEGTVVKDTNGVWTEALGPDGRGWMVDLVNGRSGELEHFERIERNRGELLLLDAKLNELPANQPHVLGRVTGEHQLHMTILRDGDNGRTVEMKPGEVFVVELETKKPVGYTWISDRPESTALLETGSGPVPGRRMSDATVSSGASSGIAVSGQGPVSAGQMQTNARSAAAARLAREKALEAARPDFQVWQLIAPPPGVLPLRFEFRKAADMTAWPVKVFTLTVVTR
jgi:hypothetical protein